MDYQHTPAASKNNAFCWHSWSPRVDWGTRAQEGTGQAKRSAIVEAKRAAGIDPLHIPGMGSAARQNPLDPARFAITRRTRK